MSDWLHISTTGGCNNGIITVTADTYAQLVERVATVTVSNNDYAISAQTEVTQYPIPIATSITFDNLTWETDVPASGGTANKNNCSYTIAAHYENGSSGDVTSLAIVTGSFNVISSSTETRHSVGNLTLTASCSGLSTNGTVEVYQEAYMPPPVSGCLLFIAEEIGQKLQIVPNNTIGPHMAVSEFEYSLDGENWTTMASGYTEFSNDKKFYLRGKSIKNVVRDTIQFYDDNNKISISGSVMSLLDWEYSNSRIIPNPSEDDYGLTFAELFGGGRAINNISHFTLPATGLTISCYMGMFGGCTSIESIPVGFLPATTLSFGCYRGMFSIYGDPSPTNRMSLYNIPNNLLPATTLAKECYSHMFDGCSLLTNIPALPATTLSIGCYMGMFYRCYSLESVPNNYLPATTLASQCYAYMFQECTSLINAPELPATSLASYCYEQMFCDCDSLHKIECYATDISAPNCTAFWVSCVAATGDFYCPSSTSWSTGRDGIPSGWTRHNI